MLGCWRRNWLHCRDWPGVWGREADAIARDVLAASDLSDAFVHGLGHGVGLLVHESPSLGTASSDILRPGQVVTIEPGIYIDGWGGIRIEASVS